MKYTLEFKLKCIKSFDEDKEIEDLKDSSRKNLYNRIWFWKRLYEVHGIDGLKHQYQKKTIDEKLALINKVDTGLTFIEVAINECILPSTLFRWYKIYKEEGIDGLKSDTRGRPRNMEEEKKKPDKIQDQEKYIKELEKRIMYLEAENAYLKKLKALIQKKDK